MRSARFIADGRVHRGRLDGDVLVDEQGRAHRADAVTWLPPVAPSKIVGFALTYRDHAAELNIEAPPDPGVKDKLEELRYLERSIGKTGLRALKPFLHISTRDVWQLTVLDA